MRTDGPVAGCGCFAGETKSDTLGTRASDYRDRSFMAQLFLQEV